MPMAWSMIGAGCQRLVQLIEKLLSAARHRVSGNAH
jgi:hypothetical protein